jgi:uncharacterized protein (DUF302 family)
MTHELTIRPGTASVASTVDALRAALDRRGIEVFAVVDHAAGAATAGLELADEVVVIFGNPAVGTPLMQADARVGIELPLRILVWSDSGTTRIAYEDPHDLASRYGVPPSTPQLDGMAGLLAQLADEIVGPAPE